MLIIIISRPWPDIKNGIYCRFFSNAPSNIQIKFEYYSEYAYFYSVYRVINNLVCINKINKRLY